MFPILLDLARLRVAVVGNGEAALKRLALLDEDGARHVAVYADDPAPALEAAAGARLRRLVPTAAELAGFHLVFAAELGESRLVQLAATVRALGTLLHVEDRPALGTVHAPATLRRGDLVISVSTNGRSPGLAKRVKRFLEGVFGEAWQGRLDELARLREGWREAGAGMGDVARWTEEWIDRQDWLPAETSALPSTSPAREDGTERRRAIAG
ncbi:MAG TPA: NAD(P)-dependent oxidoreductase [Stellaceae bacterium]|nr:NAD(P)-dependent oxidoreductase [Stellaceae bacterium]